MKEREEAVVTLWRKTSSYLVGLNVFNSFLVFSEILLSHILFIFILFWYRCWWKMGPKKVIRFLWRPETLY